MYIPLAEKIRPKCLNDIVGQHNLIDKGMPLRNLIESKNLVNMIFYGPPGTGKTSLANIAAKNSGMNFKTLNCTFLASSDIKDLIDSANNITFSGDILLYLDEIQYLNKKQQQILLQAMEIGNIKIIASTTENPYFSIYNAILSRCIVFEFKPVSYEDIVLVLEKAILTLEKETKEKIICPREILTAICKTSCGDVRKSINILETCILTSTSLNGVKTITKESLLNISPVSAFAYDKDGDSHFDLLSALQKSMRGSDPDAAVYYLARLLESGDLNSTCRRILVCACEDVGLAYPQIIPIIKSCVDTAFQVGLPEARIPLSDAVILICISPKSNSAYNAINKAQTDIKNGKIFPIPRRLQNTHCDGINEESSNKKYIYPHNFPNHWVKQTYLPNDLLESSYYIAGKNKTEHSFQEYWRKIKNEK